MAAFNDATVTIDTNEMTYTDRHEQTHVVNNAQTFVFELAAVSSVAKYKVKTDTLTCVDGYKLEISTEGEKSSFITGADATAATDAGSLWFIEDDGYQAEWHIRTVTINDIDEPTELTAMVLERNDNPMVTMTLTTITMDQ